MITQLHQIIASGLGTGVPTALLIVTLALLAAKLRQIRSNRKNIQSIRLPPGATKSYQDIPSPPSWPIIGHMYMLADYQHDHWLGLDSIREQYGDIVRLKFGTLSMVMVSSHEVMREILVQKGDIFCNRPNFFRLNIVFGDRAHSLALCDYNEVHRDRRKMCKRGVIPMKFTFRNKLLESNITKHTKLFIEMISNRTQHQDGQVNSIKNYHKVTKEDVLFLTGDIFLDFLANEVRPHSDPRYKEFNYGADFLFWDVQQSYLVDFFPFLTYFGANYSHLKHLDKIAVRLRDYVESDVFGPRYERMTKRIQLEPELLERRSETINNSDDLDFLDSIILEYHAKTTTMSLDDYRLGFADLYGGHAAVSNILMRVLGHLALNQEIQNKVYEEATRVNIENLDHIPALPIAEATVQESLRIASSPIVPHLPKEDSSIASFHIPKGTVILFNNFYVNRSEKFWHKPLEWNPMRFIEPETGRLKIPNYFWPFSIGTRQCLGFKLVETVCNMAIAHICKTFVIKSENEELTRKLLRPVGMLAINPDSDCYHLRFYPRVLNNITP